MAIFEAKKKNEVFVYKKNGGFLVSSCVFFFHGLFFFTMDVGRERSFLRLTVQICAYH